MTFLGTMRLLMRYMGPQRTKLGSELNMTPVHHRTLFYINEHDSCKMTDIANEFVSMIQNQRAYQANTRTVTVADQLLNETVNLIR